MNDTEEFLTVFVPVVQDKRINGSGFHIFEHKEKGRRGVLIRQWNSHGRAANGGGFPFLSYTNRDHDDAGLCEKSRTGE